MIGFDITVYYYIFIICVEYILWSSFWSLLWKRRLLLCKWRGTVPPDLATTFCQYCCCFQLSPLEVDKAHRFRSSSVITGCSEGTAHLQVGVAEYHKLGAGVDVIPFDEGEVHASNSLQTREIWTPLPILSVLLHHLLSETGLLTAQRKTTELQPKI